VFDDLYFVDLVVIVYYCISLGLLFCFFFLALILIFSVLVKRFSGKSVSDMFDGMACLCNDRCLVADLSLVPSATRKKLRTTASRKKVTRKRNVVPKYCRNRANYDAAPACQVRLQLLIIISLARVFSWQCGGGLRLIEVSW